jgi:sugar lactone lactonase YvrE
MPCPGDLPYEHIKGIGPVQLPDGSWVPRVYHSFGDGLGNICYPGLTNSLDTPIQRMAITPGGELLFSGRGQEVGPRLQRLRISDGSVPEEFGINVLKTNPKEPWVAKDLAISADGKWAYLCNIVDARVDNRQLRDQHYYHAVYRYQLGTGAAAEPFLGEVHKSGDDDKHLNRPAGIAVDRDGNVLIADYGNNRIAVFSAAGQYLGKVAADGPYGLAVDRKRGTLYILSVPANAQGTPVWGQKMYIAKLSGWKEPKGLGKVDVSINYYDQRYNLVLALDDRAEAPILWVGDGRGDPATATLGRIVDRAPADQGLPKLEAVSLPLSATGMRGCLRVAVDPATDRVYVNDPVGNCAAQRWQSFDGHSGKPLPTGKINGGMGYMTSDLRVGCDGTLYGYVYDGGLNKPGENNQHLRRWDLDGNPLKLEGGAEKSDPFPLGPKIAEMLKKQGRPDHQQARGLDVAADGSIYVIHNWNTVHDYRMSMLGSDGKARKVNLCPNLTIKGCCPRVDRQGNIYVLEGLLPKDVPLGPPGFAGLEKAGAGKPSGYGGYFGCVVKFPANGGAVGEAKEMPAPAEGVKRVVAASGAVVDNALWIHPYAAPAMGSHCICNNAHFDIDRYGRLFVPNALARQVEVLDTEGNRICVFGRYGNVDNGGQDSRRPVDGVPLNWGVDVAVSDTAAYISDLSNRCVVKVRLDYQAAASCPVP